MPDQIIQSVEVIDPADESVVITLEVLDNGAAHLVARDADDRVVFEFRGATLLLGNDGHGGGLQVKDAQGVAGLNYQSQFGKLVLGTIERRGHLALTGRLDVHNSSDQRVLLFDSEDGHLKIGGNLTSGKLSVLDSSDNAVLRFNASNAFLRIGGGGQPTELDVRDSNDRSTLVFTSSIAQLRIGTDGNAAKLLILDGLAREALNFNAENCRLVLGANELGASLVLRNEVGREAFRFSSNNAVFGDPAMVASIGVTDAPGELVLRDSENRTAIRHSAENAQCKIGTTGNPGALKVVTREDRMSFTVGAEPKPSAGITDPSLPEPVGHIATAKVGGRLVEGAFEIEDGRSRTALRFDSGGAAALRIGCPQREGQFVIKDSSDHQVFAFEADRALLHIGAGGQERILVDGAAGDILFKNADAAERFSVADPRALSPGMVMVLGPDGQLIPCTDSYDRRVAGVIAGAGHRRPGITMDASLSTDASVPVAVMGKVCCLVDATEASIEIGDLLTSASRLGHARRADDRERAFGAVIGKAMSPLKGGTGLVELLVALQ